jgi:hypothetical protein
MAPGAANAGSVTVITTYHSSVSSFSGAAGAALGAAGAALGAVGADGAQGGPSLPPPPKGCASLYVGRWTYDWRYTDVYADGTAIPSQNLPERWTCEGRQFMVYIPERGAVITMPLSADGLHTSSGITTSTRISTVPGSASAGNAPVAATAVPATSSPAKTKVAALSRGCDPDNSTITGDGLGGGPSQQASKPCRVPTVSSGSTVAPPAKPASGAGQPPNNPLANGNPFALWPGNSASPAQPAATPPGPITVAILPRRPSNICPKNVFNLSYMKGKVCPADEICMTSGSPDEGDTSWCLKDPRAANNCKSRESVYNANEGQNKAFMAAACVYFCAYTESKVASDKAQFERLYQESQKRALNMCSLGFSACANTIDPNLCR